MLTRAELERFERDGFVGPFRVVEPDIAMRIGERIHDEVLATRCEVYAHTKGDFEKVDYTRDRHLDSPMLFRIASAPEIVERVTRLIGPDVLLWRSDVFRQGVGDPATYPHQDIDLSGTRVIPCIAARTTEESIGTLHHPNATVLLPLCVSAWIAFSTIRADNGGLFYIPGSHREVIPEIDGDGFAGRKRVLSRTFDRSQHVAIEIEPGELMLFHNLLVHGSYPSTGERRIAWTTRYVRPTTRVYPDTAINAQGQDLARFGSLLVAGSDRIRINPLRAAPKVQSCPLVDERAFVSHVPTS